MSVTPHRHFLGWNRPLLAAVVDFLTDGWHDGVLDLSDRLVVVPTRQSGRRLREALAERAAGANAGVFPPRVLTPEAFLSVCRAPGLNVASPLLVQLAWMAVLRGVTFEDFPALFPQRATQDFAWAAGLGRALHDVRSALGENGLDFAALCQAEGPHREEIDRWRDLARLEALYRQKLDAIGCIDPDDAKRATAGSPSLPEGITRLVVAAVPDPLPLLLTGFANLAESAAIEITVLVAAPQELAGTFDPWGRPRRNEWLRRPIAIDPGRLHLRRGPGEQADAVLELADGHTRPGSTLALGLLDPELAPFLRAAAVRPLATGAFIEWFDPAGVAGSAHELFHLLGALAVFLSEGTFDALAVLLRLPAAAHALQPADKRQRLTTADLLAALDEFRINHLPGTLADALSRAPEALQPVLRAARALAAASHQGRLTEVVPEWLQRCYAARTLVAVASEGRDFLAVAQSIIEGLRELEHAAQAGGLTLAPGDQLNCLLEAVGALRLEGDRGDSAVDLQGWLELAWEPAPHLILAGCNDGCVPGHMQGDLFLPDSARVALGLRSNTTREARDAFLLTALIATRSAAGGRVDLVLGKVDAAGDPRRPSRLLSRCPAEELPGRVRLLFGEEALAPAPATPPASVAWKLRPPPAPPLKQLSVTDFKRYLRCPLRFYFSRVLGMQAVDPVVTELTPAAFGNLCHSALRHFGQDEAIRDSDDEAEIAEFLRSAVEQHVRSVFGVRPNVAVRVQQGSATRRLGSFAKWQAQTRREGWRVVEAEQMFSEFPGETSLIINETSITGRIDRIDRRGDEWRVIDFKTTDSPRKPSQTHLGPAREPAGDRAWQRVEVGGKPKLWTDLQLPLYALAMRNAHDVRPEAGYFQLAKAAGDVGYEPWTELSDELIDSALSCAEGVVDAIRSGDFRPREATIKNDEFDAMLLGDAHRAVSETFGHPALPTT